MAETGANCRAAPPPAGFEFRGVQRLESGAESWLGAKASAGGYCPPSRVREVEGLGSRLLGASAMRRRCGSLGEGAAIEMRSGTRFASLRTPGLRPPCLRLGALGASGAREGSWARGERRGERRAGQRRVEAREGASQAGARLAAERRCRRDPRLQQPRVPAPPPPRLRCSVCHQPLRVNAEPVMVLTPLFCKAGVSLMGRCNKKIALGLT